jgi:S-phase kinase-associated protein 1
MLKLLASDGTGMTISTQAAQCSHLLNVAMDDGADQDDIDAIPLHNVERSVLRDVISFCEHYALEPFETIKKPLESKDMHDLVHEWYCTFLDKPQTRIYEYVDAANFMDIPALLELTCASIAAAIKDKTPSEIRRAYEIGQQ